MVGWEEDIGHLPGCSLDRYSREYRIKETQREKVCLYKDWQGRMSCPLATKSMCTQVGID